MGLAKGSFCGAPTLDTVLPEAPKGSRPMHNGFPRKTTEATLKDVTPPAKSDSVRY